MLRSRAATESPERTASCYNTPQNRPFDMHYESGFRKTKSSGNTNKFYEFAYKLYHDGQVSPFTPKTTYQIGQTVKRMSQNAQMTLFTAIELEHRLTRRTSNARSIGSKSSRQNASCPSIPQRLDISASVPQQLDTNSSGSSVASACLTSPIPSDAPSLHSDTEFEQEHSLQRINSI